MRVRRLVPTVVSGVAAALALMPAVGSASTPAKYVALGDSYSAASGVLPPDPKAPPECLRSTRNYPHDIAATTGATLKDVTCGAAKTKDFTSSQYPGVAPQLDALNSDTDVVTMTIGGNDSNVFIGAIAQCGSLGVLHLGQGSPCKDKYGSSFDDTIDDVTYPALVKALDAVHAKAPSAKVAILGYPEILPPTGGCFPRMPVAKGDVPYLYDIQSTLNSAVERAAKHTDSTYVDMTERSTGHDACQRLGTRWIEPPGGTNPVIVHPNALGERHMADAAIKDVELG